MLQASHTRLLNSNNFAVIGDNDKVYHTDPKGLTELINRLDSTENSPIEYIAIANYCKSLILNPNINSFNLTVDDILETWEIRILCLFIVNATDKMQIQYTHHHNGELVSEKMVRFEAVNMLAQAAYLITPKVSVNKSVTAPSPVSVSLSTRLRNLLTWIKYNGKDTSLVEYLYQQVFYARFTNDEGYLSRLKSGIIGVLVNRNDLITAHSLLGQTDRPLSVVEERLHNGESGLQFAMFCLRELIDEESRTEDEGNEGSASPLASAKGEVGNKLYQALCHVLDSRSDVEISGHA